MAATSGLPYKHRFVLKLIIEPRFKRETLSTTRIAAHSCFILEAMQLQSTHRAPLNYKETFPGRGALISVDTDVQ